MIFLIILASVLLLGIIGIIVCKCVDAFSDTWAPEWFETLSVAFIVCSLIAGLAVSCPIIDLSVNEDLYYCEMVERREALVKGIEHIENTEINAATNVNIYSEVVKFNSDLRKTKRWNNNPWFGIFFSNKIAEEIDYIYLNGEAK